MDITKKAIGKSLVVEGFGFLDSVPSIAAQEARPGRQTTGLPVNPVAGVPGLVFRFGRRGGLV